MKTLLTIAFAALTVFPVPAPAATTPIEATQTCLTDNTSGKDRKLLAKWIFLSMAAHPELKTLSTATAQTQEDTSREFAGLVTRLMTVDCKNEMRALIGTDDDVLGAMKVAFSHLGEVAMQELMANKDVDASISQFGKFMDEEELSAALKPKASK